MDESTLRLIGAALRLITPAMGNYGAKIQLDAWGAEMIGLSDDPPLGGTNTDLVTRLADYIHYGLESRAVDRGVEYMAGRGVLFAGADANLWRSAIADWQGRYKPDADLVQAVERSVDQATADATAP